MSQADPAMIPCERQMLPHRPDLVAELRDGRHIDAGWVEIEPARRRDGRDMGDVILCQMRNVIWDPRSGLMQGAQGVVPSTLHAGGKLALRLPRGHAEFVPRAAVFQSHGAQGNYGHFLFDAMMGLVVLADRGLVDRFPAMSGPLRPWQREVAHLAGIPVTEVAATRVRLGEVIFTTAMNHYLHRASDLIAPLVARMGGRGMAGRGAIYLSRRGYLSRMMLEEAVLEARLQMQGVRVIRPETLSVAEQIAAVRGAEVIIGASGAALANVIFAPEGARVIELRPAAMEEPWMTLACTAKGLRHQVVRAEMVGKWQLPWSAIRQAGPNWLRRRYRYAVRVDPGAVVQALNG